VTNIADNILELFAKEKIKKMKEKKKKVERKRTKERGLISAKVCIAAKVRDTAPRKIIILSFNADTFSATCPIDGQKSQLRAPAWSNNRNVVKVRASVFNAAFPE